MGSAVLCILAMVVLRVVSNVFTMTTREGDVGINDTIRGGHLVSQCDNVTMPGPADIRHTAYGDWQVLRAGKEEVMVHSAFFDNRPILEDQAEVRIMAVARPSKAPLFCQLWYGGQSKEVSKPVVTVAKVTTVGRGDTIKHVHYGQYLFSCALGTASRVPTHVSMATTPCGLSTVLVPVVQPEPYKHEFGLCVAVSFGSLDIAHFSEWVELHLLLGVGEINIYNATLSETMRPVLSFYEKKGVLRLHQMAPPVEEVRQEGAKMGSPASLNDCMYRNMYRYRLMVVVDFDEVIVPRLHSNYSQLIRFVDDTQNLPDHWWSYSFRNTYFFHELKNSSSKESLMTGQYTNRVEPSKFLYAAKSFVDPRRCLSMFNHYCYIRFPETPLTFTLDVGTEIALSHHYRKCNFDAATCQDLYKQKTNDDYMLKYRNELLSRVQAVLKGIGHEDG